MRMFPRATGGILVATIFVALTITPGKVLYAGVASNDERKMAPDFTLTDASGKVIQLSAYKGHVVMVDFWATTCGGCKVEIPWYIEFEAKYRKAGLTTIGVALDEEGWKVVKPFVAEKKINYTIVIGNDDLAGRFGVTAMPVTLLIDRQGRIVDSHAGVVDKDRWESEIRMLLQEKASINGR
jgi:thiol-disulfide isomerase/thioredoxin